MCPNHPEHFIDWKLVTSISATERVKLWDRFSGPVDQETVKADFIRHVHRKHPPFRVKLKPKPRFCAEIPPMVEYHYKNPPPLLPSLRDVLRCEKVYKHCVPYEATNTEICKELDEDIRAFREARVKLGFPENVEDDAKTDDENDEQKQQDDADMKDVEDVENVGDAEDVEMNRSSEEIKENEATKSSSEIPEDPIDENAINIYKTQVEINEIDSTQHTIRKDLKTDPIDDLETNIQQTDPKENGINETVHTDDTHDNALTNGYAQEHVPKRKRISSSRCFGSELLDDIDDIPSKIFALREEESNNGADANEIDAELKHLDGDLIKQLAFQQLQQILSENPEIIGKYQMKAANKAIKNALTIKPKKIILPSQLLTKEDIARIAQDFLSPEKPNGKREDENGLHGDEAEQEVKYPVLPFQPPPADGIFYTNGVNHIQDELELSRAIAERLERPLHDSKIRARAVLTPVDDILRRERYAHCIGLIKLKTDDIIQIFFLYSLDGAQI